MVTANGNRIAASEKGTATAGGTDVRSTAKVTGGTGRFAHAKGQLSVHDDNTLISVFGNTGTTRMETKIKGEISY